MERHGIHIRERKRGSSGKTLRGIAEEVDAITQGMTPDYVLPVLGFFGSLISLYIVYVEYRLAHSAGYSPVCDNDQLGVSCSKVFGSDAGHLLSYVGLVPKHSLPDISNGISGLLFYLFMWIWPNLSFVSKPVKAYVTLLASLGSTAVSIILGYVMINELHEVCIVCSACHIINFFILVHAARWVVLVRRRAAKKPVAKNKDT